MQAPKDPNSVAALLAASNADGKTPVTVLANPSTHRLLTNLGTTGTDSGGTVAGRDQNSVAVLMAVASRTVTSNGVNYIQGVTPVEVYADSSTQKLLITTS